MSDNPNDQYEDPSGHGALGYWAVVGYGFNITSIVTSIFVIVSVILSSVKKRGMYERPSFRLSAWIGASDIVYSVCQICIFNNSFMKTRSEMELRTIIWLMNGSVLTFIFLTMSLGVHLFVTVIVRRWTRYGFINKYYEFVSVFCGFFIAHPWFYMFDRVQWMSGDQMFHTITDMNTYYRNMWLVQWIWLLIGIVFLGVTAIIVASKMIRSMRKTAIMMNAPEGGSGWDTYTVSMMSKQRKKAVVSVTMRIACYPIIPILTQTFALAANLVQIAPYWLFVTASIMPATQGMFNLLVFLMNPAFDGKRRRLIPKALRRENKALLISEDKTHLAFKEEDEVNTVIYPPVVSSKLSISSTIHLSPYQSREN